MTSKTADAPADDLDAVRQIAALLNPFGPDERERILRWVREKLNMPAPALSRSHDHERRERAEPILPPKDASLAANGEARRTIKDIRSFVEEKKPKTDSQFVATLAYFHRFEAPDDQRKDAIDVDDLRNAVRLVNWKRPARPSQTLQNTVRSGFVDNAGRGLFRLNSVGENLVAMVLPEDGSSGSETGTRPKKRARKAAAKGSRKRTLGKKRDARR